VIKMKLRTSITLTGEQARKFRELAIKKFGNTRLSNSKLLFLAVESFLEKSLVLVPYSRTYRRVLIEEEKIEYSVKPSSETAEIVKELNAGESLGARLFQKMKKLSEYC